MALAVYCSGTLSLTKELANRAHSWELRMLRQSFRIKPREGETDDSEAWGRFYERAGGIIDAAKRLLRRPFLIHRMPQAYFSET